MSVPSKSLNMLSRVSFPTISIWFVGSSSTSTLGRVFNILQSASLTFSPPDNIFTFLNTSSPEKRNAPSAFLASVSVRFGYSSQKSSSTVLLLLYIAICWSKYPIWTLAPKWYSPESGEIFPTIVFKKVDFPRPFPPNIPSFSPFFKSRETTESAWSYPIARSLV